MIIDMKPPRFDSDQPVLVNCAEDDTFTLYVDYPSGDEPITFDWSRWSGTGTGDGDTGGSEEPLGAGARFTSGVNEGRAWLCAEHAQPGDAGAYTVRATNAAGAARKRILLAVQPAGTPVDQPPNFVRRLTDLAVKVGSRTRLLVEIASTSDVEVVWFRNDRRLLEAERFRIFREGRFFCVEVSPVSVEDGGRWTCTAENCGGRSSCSAHLNVLVPKAYKRPEFLEELRALLTEQGTVSLECKVVGVPTPVLRWFKDSKEIKAGDVFALTANPDDPTSLGTYTCEAVNCMGKTYSSSEVHVVGRGSREGSLRPADNFTSTEPPPIFTKELENQEAKVGEKLTMTCQVVVPPWPKTVVWYNKEGRIDSSEKYRVLEDGLGGYMVEVPSSEWCDEGEWKCVATSNEGRVGISTSNVSMTVPKNYRKPRFMENLRAVLTEEGLVSFECKVVGFPTPLLSWFKDGQELKPGDVYQLTGTNSLGSYCCIAKNCMGQASSSAELTVEDIQNQLNDEERMQLFSKNQAPKFIQGLKSQEAKINENFRFSVKVSFMPEPTLFWYRDDQPIEDSARYKIIKESKGMCHLDIQQLEFMDQAEWKCFATNEFGHSVTSCFLKLIIPRHFKKPRFLENLRAILSEEGAVNLECKVIGVPQPVLKWYKDGEELKPGDIHRIISGQDGTCCLGTYTCEAQNCMGIAASSASLLGFEETMKASKNNKKVEPEPLLQRNISLSTIHEERTSQMYDTPVGDITLDDRGEISFSFDGKEVSVSLYETPDLTEEEALQIVEMYADQLSENVTEHNIVELPPLRFVKETSTSGNLLMEAIVIDVTPDYFTSAEEDLRTEADVDDMSVMEDPALNEGFIPADIVDNSGRVTRLTEEMQANLPKRPPRKKSESAKSGEEFYSMSKENVLPTDLKNDDSRQTSASEQQTFASAKSSKNDLEAKAGEMIQKEIEANGELQPKESSTEGFYGLTVKVSEDALKKIIHLSKICNVIQSHLQAVEEEVIMQSAKMSSAAAANKSLEVISSISKPIDHLQNIINISKQKSLPATTETFAETFKNFVEPLKVLHDSLAIVEKCVEVGGSSNTLVQRTSICLIETLSKPLLNALGVINEMEKTLESYMSHANYQQVEMMVTDMMTGLKLSEESIRSAQLIQQASELNEKTIQSSQKPKPKDNSIILQDIWKPVVKLQRSVQSIKANISSEEAFEMQDYIMDLIIKPIQELQVELDNIEQAAVTESQENIHSINMVILETVVQPMHHLRNGLDSMNSGEVAEKKIEALEKVVDDLLMSIAEIKDGLVSISTEFGVPISEPFEKSQEVIQQMARNLLSLQSHADGAKEDEKFSTLPDFNPVQNELFKILETAVQMPPMESSTALESFVQPTTMLNQSFALLNEHDIGVFLKASSDSLRTIHSNICVMAESATAELKDNLITAKSTVENLISSITDLEAAEEQPKAVPEEISIMTSIADNLMKGISMIETNEQTESLKDMSIKDVVGGLKRFATKLLEFRDSVAAVEHVKEESAEELNTLGNFSITDTLAKPLHQLNDCLNVVSEVCLEALESRHSLLDVSILKTLAKPLCDFHHELQVAHNDIYSQICDKPDDVFTDPTIIKNLHELEECLLEIQQQVPVEGIDDMSTLEDISAIKTTADQTQSLIETAMAFDQNMVFETAPSATDKFEKVEITPTQTLFKSLTTMQQPAVLEVLNSLSERTELTALKTMPNCMFTLQNSIESLQNLQFEFADSINNMQPEKKAELKETLKELKSYVATIQDQIKEEDGDKKQMLDTISEPICQMQQDMVKIEEIIGNLDVSEKIAKPLLEPGHISMQQHETINYEALDEMSDMDVTSLRALVGPLEDLRVAIGAIQEEKPWDTCETIVDRSSLPSEKLATALQELLTGIAIVQKDVLTDVASAEIKTKESEKHLEVVAKPLQELHKCIATVQENLINEPHDDQQSLKDFTYSVTLAESLEAVQKCFATLEQHDIIDLTMASDLQMPLDADSEKYAKVTVDQALVDQNEILLKVIDAVNDIEKNKEDISKESNVLPEKMKQLKQFIIKAQEIFAEPLEELLKRKCELRSILNESSIQIESIRSEPNVETIKNETLKKSLERSIEAVKTSVVRMKDTFDKILHYQKQTVFNKPIKDIKTFTKEVDILHFSASSEHSLSQELRILEGTIVPLREICHRFELADLSSDATIDIENVLVASSQLYEPLKSILNVINQYKNYLKSGAVETSEELIKPVYELIAVVENVCTSLDNSKVEILQNYQLLINVAKPLKQIGVHLVEEMKKIDISIAESTKQNISEVIEPIRNLQECLATVQKQLMKTDYQDEDTLSCDLSLVESYAEPIIELQKDLSVIEEQIILSGDVSSLTDAEKALLKNAEATIHDLRDNLLTIEESNITSMNVEILKTLETPLSAVEQQLSFLQEEEKAIVISIDEVIEPNEVKSQKLIIGKSAEKPQDEQIGIITSKDTEMSEEVKAESISVNNMEMEKISEIKVLKSVGEPQAGISSVVQLKKILVEDQDVEKAKEAKLEQASFDELQAGKSSVVQLEQISNVEQDVGKTKEIIVEQVSHKEPETGKSSVVQLEQISNVEQDVGKAKEIILEQVSPKEPETGKSSVVQLEQVSVVEQDVGKAKEIILEQVSPKEPETGKSSVVQLEQISNVEQDVGKAKEIILEQVSPKEPETGKSSVVQLEQVSVVEQDAGKTKEIIVEQVSPKESETGKSSVVQLEQVSIVEQDAGKTKEIIVEQVSPKEPETGVAGKVEIISVDESMTKQSEEVNSAKVPGIKSETGKLGEIRDDSVEQKTKVEEEPIVMAEVSTSKTNSEDNVLEKEINKIGAVQIDEPQTEKAHLKEDISDEKKVFDENTQMYKQPQVTAQILHEETKDISAADSIIDDFEQQITKKTNAFKSIEGNLLGLQNQQIENYEYAADMSEATDISFLKTLAGPLEELRLAIGAIQQGKSWETCENLQEISPVFGEKLNASLRELMEGIAIVQRDVLIESINDIPSEDMMAMETQARPLQELYKCIAAVQENLVADPQSEQRTLTDFSYDATLAESLTTVQKCFAVLEQHYLVDLTSASEMPLQVEAEGEQFAKASVDQALIEQNDVFMSVAEVVTNIETCETTVSEESNILGEKLRIIKENILNTQKLFSEPLESLIKMRVEADQLLSLCEQEIEQAECEELFKNIKSEQVKNILKISLETVKNSLLRMRGTLDKVNSYQKQIAFNKPIKEIKNFTKQIDILHFSASAQNNLSQELSVLEKMIIPLREICHRFELADLTVDKSAVVENIVVDSKLLVEPLQSILSSSLAYKAAIAKMASDENLDRKELTNISNVAEELHETIGELCNSAKNKNNDSPNQNYETLQTITPPLKKIAKHLIDEINRYKKEAALLDQNKTEDLSIDEHLHTDANTQNTLQGQEEDVTVSCDVSLIESQPEIVTVKQEKPEGSENLQQMNDDKKYDSEEGNKELNDVDETQSENTVTKKETEIMCLEMRNDEQQIDKKLETVELLNEKIQSEVIQELITKEEIVNKEIAEESKMEIEIMEEMLKKDSMIMIKNEEQREIEDQNQQQIKTLEKGQLLEFQNEKEDEMFAEKEYKKDDMQKEEKKREEMKDITKNEQEKQNSDIGTVNKVKKQNETEEVTQSKNKEIEECQLMKVQEEKDAVEKTKDKKEAEENEQIKQMKLGEQKDVEEKDAADKAQKNKEAEEASRKKETEPEEEKPIKKLEEKEAIEELKKVIEVEEVKLKEQEKQKHKTEVEEKDKKEKETEEAKVNKEKELQEEKRKKEVEEKEAAEKLKKAQEAEEAKLKKEKELEEEKRKKEIEEKEAAKKAKIKKEAEEAKLKKEKEIEEEKRKKEIEEKEAAEKAKIEKEAEEAKLKKEKELDEMKRKKEIEEKEAAEKAKKEKEAEETKLKKEKELEEEKRKKEAEEKEAAQKLKKDKEAAEAKLKQEKEFEEEKRKREIEEKEAAEKLKKDKEVAEAKLKLEKELEEEKRKKEIEEKEAAEKAKREKEAEEAKLKKEKELEEEKRKKEIEEKEVAEKAKKKKEAKEAKLKKEKEIEEEKRKKELEEKEAAEKAKKKKEAEETKLKKEKELEEEKRKREVEEKEAAEKMKKDKEAAEAKLKQEKEVEEEKRKKEIEEKEAAEKVKKKKEAEEAKLKKEKEIEDEKRKKELEEKEAAEKAKKEKEAEEAKLKKEKQLEEEKRKKEIEEKEAAEKAKKEKEAEETKLKKEKELEEEKRKKEAEEKEAAQKLKKAQEAEEAKLKKEKELEEEKRKKEDEEKEAAEKAKKEMEAEKAKLKKENELEEEKRKKEIEEKDEAEKAKKEKEAEEAKHKKEKELEEEKRKKEIEEKEAAEKAKKKKEAKEAKLKKEKVLEEEKRKKELEEEKRKKELEEKEAVEKVKKEKEAEETKLKKEKELEEEKRKKEIEEKEAAEESKREKEAEEAKLKKEKELEEEKRKKEIEEKEVAEKAKKKKEAKEAKLKKEKEIEEEKRKKELEEKEAAEKAKKEKEAEETKLKKEKELEEEKRKREVEEKEAAEKMKKDKEAAEAKLKQEKEVEEEKRKKEIEEKEAAEKVKKKKEAEEAKLKKEKELEEEKHKKDLEEKEAAEKAKKKKEAEETKLKKEKELEEEKRKKEVEEKEAAEKMKKDKEAAEAKLKQEKDLEEEKRKKEIEEKEAAKKAKKKKEAEEVKLKKEKEMEEEKRKKEVEEKSKKEKEAEEAKLKKEKEVEEQRRIKEIEEKEVAEKAKKEKEAEEAKLKKEKEYEEEKRKKELEENETAKKSKKKKEVDEAKLKKEKEIEEEKRKKELEEKEAAEKTKKEKEAEEEELKKEKELEEEKRKKEAEEKEAAQKLKKDKEAAEAKLKQEKELEEEKRKKEIEEKEAVEKLKKDKEVAEAKLKLEKELEEEKRKKEIEEKEAAEKAKREKEAEEAKLKKEKELEEEKRKKEIEEKEVAEKAKKKKEAKEAKLKKEKEIEEEKRKKELEEKEAAEKAKKEKEAEEVKLEKDRELEEEKRKKEPKDLKLKKEKQVKEVTTKKEQVSESSKLEQIVSHDKQESETDDKLTRGQEMKNILPEIIEGENLKNQNTIKHQEKLHKTIKDEMDRDDIACPKRDIPEQKEKPYESIYARHKEEDTQRRTYRTTVEVETRTKDIAESKPAWRDKDISDSSKSSALKSMDYTSQRYTSVTRDHRKKPMFCTHLTDRTAVEGSRVKLTCSILGSPEPNVQWFRNGILLTDQNKYQMKYKDGLATLEVLNTVPSDSAEYTCTANNENGTNSSSAQLKVYAGFEATPIPPTFTRSIRDKYHAAEDELVLECRIRGQPLPTITWMRDGKVLSADSRYHMNYLADGVCRLVIDHPGQSDSGRYTCKAENALWSDQITHDVYFAGRDQHIATSPLHFETLRYAKSHHDARRPHFSTILSDHAVAAGGTIALQVRVMGGPADVVWLKGDKPLSFEDTKIRTFTEQGLYTLALFDASETESGRYICRAINAFGKVDMAASVKVISPGTLRSGKPALFVHRPESDMSVNVGEDIYMCCRAQGDPKPKLIWMKGTHDITNSRRSMRDTSDDYHRFTLKRAVASDAGTYCIMAKNCYGCDRAFVTVVVRQRDSMDSIDLQNHSTGNDYADVSYLRDVPQPVSSEPVAVDGGNNWVSLWWGKPTSKGAAPVLAYRVEAWMVGGDGGARWAELGVSPINSYDAFNLRPGSEYHFRITPKNRYGYGESTQTTTPIIVGQSLCLPEFTTTLPGQLKALINQSVTLKCKVKADKTPTIVWHKDGAEIEQSDRIKTKYIRGECSMTISSVTEEDEGRYMCEAIHRDGRASTFVRLSVVIDPNVWEADDALKRRRDDYSSTAECAPQFTMRLRDRRVQATYPVRLTCQVIGKPTPEVVWTKNGEVVHADRRHSFWSEEQFHTLEIDQSVLSDGGIYSATASNSRGSVSCRCSLVVDKGIRAYMSPDFFCGLEPECVVQEGEELRLSACVEAYPSVGIAWHRDGIKLRPSRRAVMTLDHDGGVELALAKVTPRDSGVYTCTATNEVGKCCTSTKVVVEGGVERLPLAPMPALMSPDTPYSKEPIFIKKPRSSEAMEGDTVIILCEVAGDPKPEVMWLRDFLKPEYYRDARQLKRVGDGPEYRLLIPHAKLDHTGAYSVIAKNCHGEAKAIISLQIYTKGPDNTMDRAVRTGRVEVLPSISQELKDVRCCDGDAVTLECRIKGVPEPTIKWEKDGMPVPNSGDFKFEIDGETVRLIINNVYPEDEGMYTCIASNPLGKSYTSSCLVVDVPEEKENLLSQQLVRPPVLLSAGSTPRSTPCRSPSPAPANRHRETISQTRTTRTNRWKLAPPKFYAVPFNRVAEEGETVVFRCSIAGHPVPWVIWDKDGVEVTPSGRITIKEHEEDRILQISDVTFEDAGLYKVTVDNEVGRVEATARLEVIKLRGSSSCGYLASDSLSFRRRLVNSMGKSGDDLALKSEIRNSRYDVKSKWYKNGHALQMSDRVAEVRKNNAISLCITSLRPSDKGTYTLVVSNELGEASSWANVDVLAESKPTNGISSGRPYFVEPLSDINTVDGQTIDMVCRVGCDRLFDVVWMRDDKVVPDCDYFRYVDYGNGLIGLRLDDIFSQDSGRYTCRVTTTGGVCKTSCKVVVDDDTTNQIRKNDFSVLPQPVLVEEGKSASFEARLRPTTKFKDLTVVWQVAGRVINDSDPRFELKSNGCTHELKIRDVCGFDSGTVRCAMRANLNRKHTHPYESLWHTTYLTVVPGTYMPETTNKQHYPQFLTMIGEVTAVRGKNLVIRAPYRAEPEPSVRWMKSDREIVPNERFLIKNNPSETYMIIDCATKEDSGKYHVELTNDLGKETQQFFISVEGAPDAPTEKPTVDRIGDDVTVTWPVSAANIRIPVMGYHLEVCKVSSGPTWKTIAHKIKTNSFAVNGLEKNQAYSFRIRVENAYGVGEPGAESDPFNLEMEDKSSSGPKLHDDPKLLMFNEKYKTYDVLGRGKFGIVKLIVNKHTNEKIAAKFIKTLKPKDKENVLSELEIMHQLRHPKLIQFIEAYVKPAEIVIVTEYVSGGELFERVSAEDFTLTERDCVLFMSQICDGVKFMHDNNIVHLDLKPENIMCQTRPSQEIKIIDFGLARRLNPNEEIRVFCGTPEFIAPEIVNFDPISKASDMWSIGVICYVLLSGLSPFSGDSLNETYSNILQVMYDFEDEAFDNITNDAKEFIEGLLVKTMNKRRTAEECLQSKWILQHKDSRYSAALSTDKLKKFVYQSKWQITGNAIRAVGRMVSLSTITRLNANKTPSEGNKAKLLPISEASRPI